MRKLKTMLVLLLTLGLAALFSTTALADNAASGTCGENATWTLEDGILTISGTGDMTDYYSYDSTPWYWQRSSINAVVVENGLTSIGMFAFYNCSSLTSITIPNSVTSIGWCAFKECNDLTSVEIPDSVTSIAAFSFSECSNLIEILVSADNIAYSSEDGVLFNKEKTVLVCYPGGKGTSYVIPSSVVSIDECAFFGCNNLSSVTIPPSVTFISDDSFANSNSLIELLVSVDNANYSSEDGVLFNKDKTVLACYPAGKTEVSCKVPSYVTSIGKSAFWGNTNLTSVTIPDNVTSIGATAFERCSNLTSLTISDSVTSVGSAAFIYCYNLTDVYYSGNEAEWNEIEIGSNNDYLLSATIHYNSTGPEDADDTGDTDTSGDSSGGTDAATPGDLNGDSEVNASDLTILARHVGKVETMEDETYLANADMTGDGNVDASDLTKLAQYVGKIISSLD